jgi:hypothetical protein
MGVIPQYYGGHTAATATTGGGGVAVGTTIETIVKIGILATRPLEDPGPAERALLPNDSQAAGRSVAFFAEGIPTHYELYYNGQWYNKGQLNEIKLGTTTFEFPTLVWQLSSDVLEMKYQIVVSA